MASLTTDTSLTQQATALAKEFGLQLMTPASVTVEELEQLLNDQLKKVKALHESNQSAGETKEEVVVNSCQQTKPETKPGNPNLENMGGMVFQEPKCNSLRTETLEGTIHGHIRHVNHVTRIVLDVDRSFQFYNGVLGLPKLNRPNFPSKGYWLHMGNIQLHLIQAQSESHAQMEAMHDTDLPVGNVNHLAFEVWDFAKTEQRIKTSGIEFRKNLVPQGGEVIKQIFLSDPDGHFIEICDCHRMNSFVYQNGDAADQAEAKRLADNYIEGVNPPDALMAILAMTTWMAKSAPRKEGDLDNDTMARMRGFEKAFYALVNMSELEESEALEKNTEENTTTQKKKKKTKKTSLKTTSAPEGYVSVDGLSHLMQRMNLHHSKAELACLVNKYDTGSNGGRGGLSYIDFATLVAAFSCNETPRVS